MNNIISFIAQDVTNVTGGHWAVSYFFTTKLQALREHPGWRCYTERPRLCSSSAQHWLSGFYDGNQSPLRSIISTPLVRNHTEWRICSARSATWPKFECTATGPEEHINVGSQATKFDPILAVNGCTKAPGRHLP